MEWVFLMKWLFHIPKKEKYFEKVKEATEKLTSKGFKVHHLTDDDVLFFDGINAIIL